MHNYLKVFYDRRVALLALVKADIKNRVANRRIGWVWLILDPLFLMAAYFFMIKIVFSRGGENYHLVVLAGIISWQLFSNVINGVSASLSRNKSLISQLNIPLVVFTVVPVIVNLFYASMGSLVLIAWSYETFSINVIYFPMILFVIAMLGYGIGLIFAVLIAFIPDLREIIKYMLRVGFFLSPVLYPVERILESSSIPLVIKNVYLMNPMVELITNLRGSVLLVSDVSMQQVFLWLLFVLALVYFSLNGLTHFTSNIIKRL